MTKYEEKVISEIRERGYIEISNSDPFIYKRRNTLHKLSIEGKLKMYHQTPSYSYFAIGENK